MLRIYNSLTRTKQEFIPLEPEEVKMYVCGVTVYDYCHLGHARAYVVWDMVRRYLQYAGYKVRYVQNITDIDDKILNRAQKEGVEMNEISDRYIKAYQEDMAKLNILPADSYPRATTSIPEIIDLIKSLIGQDYAYSSGGDVYYAVRKFPSYGKLSGRKLEDMQAGASGRVDQSEPLKHYPFDFALWKSAKPNEPYWESTWGNGRPGWHIECSAMVKSEFGDRLDIHAGGADLQFPHHENEIAQSEAITNLPLANYWMHNGFVNIDGEKMSKSLGNFTTIRGLLETYDPMAVRLFILQSHYRTPIDFTEEAINVATKGWMGIQEAWRFKRFGVQLNWQEFDSSREFSGTIDAFPFDVNWGIDLTFNRDEFLDEAIIRFKEAMDDDFNTPVAISILHELVTLLNTERNNLRSTKKIRTDSHTLWKTWKTIQYIAQILGFDFNSSSLSLRLLLKDLQSCFSNLTEDAKESVNQEWDNIDKAHAFGYAYRIPLGWRYPDFYIESTDLSSEILLRFRKTIDNGFITNASISIVRELATLLNSESNNLRSSLEKDTNSSILWETWRTLQYLAQNLAQTLEVDLRQSNYLLEANMIEENFIKDSIDKRKEAKKNKNWSEADRIRDELKEDLEITLIDQADGEVMWHYN